jgi:hypothetical protein
MDRSYFVNKQKKHWFYQKFSETDIINMLEILINNIFAMFGGLVFQDIGIPIGANCAPLHADLFLCSYMGFSRKTKRSNPIL